jgi:anti-sigma factor RsiW
MTSLMTDHQTENPHPEIEELLPWYANGTLTPAETSAVERHLEQCPACRLELEQCRVLATQLHDQAEAAWQPTASHFDRLLADLDRLTPLAPAPASPPLLQRLRAWLQATPSPVRWTLALESLAVAALVLVVALPAPPTEPGYETLSDEETVPATAGPRLRVVFADSATVGEIQQLLRGIDAQIVAGPTPLGVYTLAVSGGERPAAVQDQAAAALRGHPQVRLVEPLEPR